MHSGKRALEGGSVCRCPMCGEHQLNWQGEQWPQSLEDLLADDACAQPLVQLQAPSEVDKRIAGNDRAATLDPQDEVVVLTAPASVDPTREPVAGPIPMDGIAAAPKPLQVRTAVTRLLGSDAVLINQILRGVRWRRENGGAQPLDERPRVALVPRRGEHNCRLTFPREREQRIRHSDRVEQQQALPVVDRARGHLPRPPLLRRPFWMRCLPMPKPSP